MDWETLRLRLENILQKDVTLEKAPAEFETSFDRRGNKAIFEVEKNVRLVVHGSLTGSEEKLIALLFDSHRAQHRRGRSEVGQSEEERQAYLLSSWVMEKLEQGDLEAVLPGSMTAWPSLSGTKIPILLYGEYPERQQYGELRKLLHTFFDAEVTLIPLHNKQWFILADESLLHDTRNDEGLEASLKDFASGLQEMFASEWVGDCDVAVTYPINPSKAFISTIVTLREMIDLGRAYRFSSSNVHVPWELRLEALLDKAPDHAKRRFVDAVFKSAEAALDAELITTLDTFFSGNCNVSDTAKLLYIHRNTLLYRLDKFKQETGLDVRDFDHAVLVKLALLLYKVTKRK